MSSDYKSTQKPTLEEICKNLQQSHPIKEIKFPRFELKAEWNKKHGSDISAIANHDSMLGGWLVVGICDNGKLMGKNIKWAESTEKDISCQVNEFLSPFYAVANIFVREFPEGCCILIDIKNTGDLIEWDGKAYKLTGTSSTEMTPDEKISLALKMPGDDFTKKEWEGSVDSSLVLKYARKVKDADPRELSEELENLSSNQILQILHIKNTYVAHILFGNIPVRIAYYDENEDVIDTQTKYGAYSILSDEFISEIQNWTRKEAQSTSNVSISAVEEVPYPTEALREILANAVAHALYQKNEAEIIVDLFPDRLVIRNNAFIEARAFSKQWFARQTHVKNKLLMVVLRMAKISDELGSGKMKVYRLMLEGAKREPIIEFEDLRGYGKWKITLYNQERDHHFKSLLQRLFDTLPSKNHARLAAALILWKENTWSNILEKLDEHFKLFAKEIIASSNSPVLIIDNKVFLKRWAEVILTGQATKPFSLAEENSFYKLLQARAFKLSAKGLISTSEARKLIGLSDSRAEITQLSNLFRKWKKEKMVEQEEKRGEWRFPEPS